MPRLAFFAAALIGLASCARSESPGIDPYHEISDPIIREIEDDAGAAALPLFANECQAGARSADPVTWDQIVRAGREVWQIIESNKPVVHVETPVAHALPAGLSCWADLDGWRAPATRTFEVIYNNGFGMEVVKFRFRLHFSHGGGRDGMGRYLANVTVMPAELNVVWGYTFNSRVEVGRALNLGDAKNPMAGLELNLKWNVKTVLKESENSFHFFVQGDGESKTAH